LDNTAAEFFIHLNTEKTKIMVVRGTEPIRSKIYINGRLLEQMNGLNYLEFNISHEGEKDLTINITNSIKILRIITHNFQKNTDLYKTVAMLKF
jgi:hypothetical protein